MKVHLPSQMSGPVQSSSASYPLLRFIRPIKSLPNRISAIDNLSRSPVLGAFAVLLFCAVARDASAQYSCQNVVVTGAATSARVGSGPIQFVATQNGAAVPGGHWDIGNGFAYGGIDQTGLYIPPTALPSPASSVIYYNLPGCPRTTTISLLNAAPQITWFEPGTISQLNAVVLVHGANFMPTSTVTINGQPTSV